MNSRNSCIYNNLKPKWWWCVWGGYNRDFPPPPETGTKEEKMAAYARWYLDFTAKIDPWMKKKDDPCNADSHSEATGNSGEKE
jgi:hypothetical protein